MTYELAKKLQDNGFPQGFNTIPAVNPIIQPNRYDRGMNGNIVLIPTLSELIEACGWSFRSLSKHSDGRWICKTGARATGQKSKLISGHSMEEAVAKLWLELNKK